MRIRKILFVGKGLKLWNYYEYTFFPDGKIKLVKKYEAQEWN